MKVQMIIVIVRTDCHRAVFSDMFGHKIEGSLDIEHVDEKWSLAFSLMGIMDAKS